jgi:predicted transcriptional regulator
VDTCRGIAHPLQFKAAMLNQKRQAALSGRDVPEVLARLSELRAAGTITDEEFEREKRELLERL